MSQLNFDKLVADTAKQITGLLAPAKAPPAAKGRLPKAAPAKPVKAAAKPEVVRERQLKQLKALGQVEQMGERKLARYRRAVAKKG